MTLQILLHLHLVAHFHINHSAANTQPVGNHSDHTLYVDYLQISTKYDHMYNHMYLQLANKYTAAFKHSIVLENIHSIDVYVYIDVYLLYFMRICCTMCVLLLLL